MVSKSQQRATAKYNLQNYDRVELRLPKGEKERLKEYLAENGSSESVNAFVSRAIRQTMATDTGNLPEYIEAVKRELIDSSWKYTPERAQEIVLRDARFIMEAFTNGTDPGDVAADIGYGCG